MVSSISTPLWAYLYICNHICTSGWYSPKHVATTLYTWLVPLELPTPPVEFIYLPLLESRWAQMLRGVLVNFPAPRERAETGRTVEMYMEETQKIGRIVQYSIIHELGPRIAR